MPGRGLAQGIIRITINRDHSVDLNIDIMHQENKGVKPLRNSRAAAKRSDICELIEDEEDNRVRQAVELIQVVGWVSIYSCFWLHLFSEFASRMGRSSSLTGNRQANMSDLTKDPFRFRRCLELKIPQPLKSTGANRRRVQDREPQYQLWM